MSTQSNLYGWPWKWHRIQEIRTKMWEMSRSLDVLFVYCLWLSGIHCFAWCSAASWRQSSSNGIETGSCDRKLPIHVTNIQSNIQSIILMQTEHVEISWRAFSDASLSYSQGFCLCHMAASRRRFDVLTHTIAIDCHFHCSCLKEYFAQTAHFEGKQLSKYDKHQNKPKT